MITVEEAQQRILAALVPLAVETVPVTAAHGRFLAEDTFAAVDLPGFDNSAMDGYAVRAAAVEGAAAESPVTLRVLGQAPAGDFFSGAVSGESCVRIFTGSPMPEGADAVVMQEDTRTPVDGKVEILERVRAWENVRLQGEDARRGCAVGAAGDRLSAGKIALLTASGIAEVRVGRRPVTGLLATGNELREAGVTLRRGEIFESNRAMLRPLVTAAGGVAKIYPIAPDTLAATRAALEQALAECDVVITTGGVSVGALDFVKAAWTELGGTLDFWRVSMKPGKPFAFGRCGGKIWFGLPGNPVSALVTFLQLARPALLRMQGAVETGLPTHSAVLAAALANRGDRRHFMRVRVDEAGRVHSAGGQASHLLSSAAAANGLVDVPAGMVWNAGETVNVQRWEW